MRVGNAIANDGSVWVRLLSDACVPAAAPCSGPAPSGSSIERSASMSWRRSTTALKLAQSALWEMDTLEVRKRLSCSARVLP